MYTKFGCSVDESIGSEQRQRSLFVGLLGSKLASEAALLSFLLQNCGDELRAAPLTYLAI